MIEVLKSGLMTSIQDHGRMNASRFGVPKSGAMDRGSMDLANMLLNNAKGSAVLEITFLGPELKFKKPLWICLTGADLSPVLNDNPLSMQHPILIDTDDVLRFGPPKYGIRTYLAVKGGFQSEVVMGSQSQYVPVTVSKGIQTGDLLVVNPTTSKLIPSEAHIRINHAKFQREILEVFPGPEYDGLNDDQKALIHDQFFTISGLNNRMAYQLEETIPNRLNPIITSHVLPGTVQLTPSGKMIILMRDAQTTGGYPRVLQLTEDSIDCLAQKFTKQKLRFTGQDI